MLIPSHFLPIKTAKPKLTKRGEVTLDKTETNPDGAKEASNSHVLLYEKREGEDRRKRKIKPLLDTRSRRDRRYNKESIDITA